MYRSKEARLRPAGGWHRLRLAAALVALAVATLALPLVQAGPAGGAPAPDGSWAPAPAPARMVQWAVALTNGKVLAGGNTLCPGAICWELYDPVLNVWAAAGRTDAELPNQVPLVATLTALYDGGAFVTLLHTGGPLKERLRYRFDGSGWVKLPSPPPDGDTTRGNSHTATLLDPPFCRQPSPPDNYPCGKVLLLGGNNPGSDAKQSRNGELYSHEPDDPQPDRFLPITTLGQDRAGHSKHAAALLADGRVMMIGREPVASSLNYREVNLFDPRSVDLVGPGGSEPPLGSWTSGEDLPSAFTGTFGRLWALQLPDGRVLTNQEHPGNDGPPASPPMLFDPKAGDRGKWTVLSSCPTVTCGVPVLMPDGTVVTIGRYGYRDDKPPLAKALRLDPAHPDPGTWTWMEGGDDGGFGAPDVPAWTALLLDGNGDPKQCGTNCGNILAAGGVVLHTVPNFETRITEGRAQIFELFQLDSLSASSGPACGGQTLTLSGRGLGGVAAVNFGAVTVSDISIDEAGKAITLKAPRHAPGSVPVTVTMKNGTTKVPASDLLYRFDPVEPARIKSLLPPEGRATGNTSVVVDGSFVADCVRSVRFGDKDTASYVVDSAGPGTFTATKITATSPPGEPGQQVVVSVDIDPGPPAPADIAVPSIPTRPGADVFTYLALPAITAVTPPRGPAFGGSSVTLAGTGLEGATEVHFGDTSVPASAFSVNATGTSISATLPAHDPGTVPVTVTTPKRGDSMASAGSRFTYHPGISGLFPPSGPLTGGTEVTIAGRGFTGAQAVRFGTASVVPLSLTDTEILVRTPPHGLPEAVPVQLTASGLNSLPENVMFDYGLADVAEPDPEIDPGSGPPKQSSTTPQPAPPGGSPAASPANAPSAANAPSPGNAPSPNTAPTPGVAPTPGTVTGHSGSPTNSLAVLPPPIPVASPVAAPGTAMGQASPGTGQGVAGAGEEDEGEGAHRYAMSDARTTLALGAAGATGCFTFLAAARHQPARRRRRSSAGRPQPKGAY